MNRSGLILAYDALRDPRDLAEVLHLAAGLGAEVHLIGSSLETRHPKVLRKLRSWRPEMVERAEALAASRFGSVADWSGAVRERGYSTVAMVLAGGAGLWSEPPGLPLAILFGEETHGLSSQELARCERRWSIPLGPGGRFYTVGQATALVLGGCLLRR